MNIVTAKGIFERVPAAYGRIDKYKELIVETLLSTNEAVLKEYWQHISISENRLLHWCKLAAIAAGTSKEECVQIYNLLRAIFNI